MNISRIAMVQEFRQTWRDYYQLTKPKVVALLLLTAWVGMWLAPAAASQPGLMLIALTGIGLLSAAAAALNHVLDQNIDAKMARTQRRPVATGRVSPQQAVTFAFSLAIAGFILLYWFVTVVIELHYLTSFSYVHQ